MLYKIHNFGISKDIIVKGKLFFLTKGADVTTEDEDFAREAAKFLEVEVTEVYEKMNYFELRKIAKEKNIKFKNTIKKEQLLKLMNKEGEK